MTVEGDVHCEEVTLRVVDDGPGIPVHERERISSPSFARRGTTRARGSGLGLAIAKGFVAVNGGRLLVEQAQSGGAVFVLVLPAVMLPAEVRG